MKLRHRPAAAALIAVAIAFSGAACGGDSADDDTQAGAPTTAETATPDAAAEESAEQEGATGTGDGDTGMAPPTEDGAAAGGGQEPITVVETSFDLSSPSVEQEGEALTVNVDAPGTYTFEAVNDADIPHALAVSGMGVDQATGNIAPGESATLTVELSEAGRYDLFCPITNHKQLGMDGTVVVGG